MKHNRACSVKVIVATKEIGSWVQTAARCDGTKHMQGKTEKVKQSVLAVEQMKGESESDVSRVATRSKVMHCYSCASARDFTEGDALLHLRECERFHGCDGVHWNFTSSSKTLARGSTHTMQTCARITLAVFTESTLASEHIVTWAKRTEYK
jgi:hypothetical protein